MSLVTTVYLKIFYCKNSEVRDDFQRFLHIWPPFTAPCRALKPALNGGHNSLILHTIPHLTSGTEESHITL